MAPAAIIFFVAGAIAVLLSARKNAPIPLLLCSCYLTMGQGIMVGPLNFPVFRMLLAVGLLRILLKGEKPVGGWNLIDKLLFGWAGWVMFASLFHEYIPGAGPQYTAGVVFSLCLSYLLFRILVRDTSEVTTLIKVIAIVLVPVALEMISETITGKNLFAVFGGVEPDVTMRDGRFRAQGPFLHPIMAGTTGAVLLPLVLSLWNYSRWISFTGVAACLLMVVASASSGPIMSTAFGLFAVACWRMRHWTSLFRKLAVLAYLALSLVMERPAYYILGSVNVVGGSTGWHRARIIEQTINHFHEWWLFGTDYTSHWMPEAVAIDGRHADITNYYISFAIFGGVAALILVLLMLGWAFCYVGRAIRALPDSESEARFFIWCLGSGLFAHAMTSVSVAYMDQTVVFFWMNLAVISSIYSAQNSQLGGDLMDDRSSQSSNGDRPCHLPERRQSYETGNSIRSVPQ